MRNTIANFSNSLGAVCHECLEVINPAGKNMTGNIILSLEMHPLKLSMMPAARQIILAFFYYKRNHSVIKPTGNIVLLLETLLKRAAC